MQPTRPTSERVRGSHAGRREEEGENGEKNGEEDEAKDKENETWRTHFRQRCCDLSLETKKIDTGLMLLYMTEAKVAAGEANQALIWEYGRQRGWPNGQGLRSDTAGTTEMRRIKGKSTL